MTTSTTSLPTPEVPSPFNHRDTLQDADSPALSISRFSTVTPRDINNGPCQSGNVPSGSAIPGSLRRSLGLKWFSRGQQLLSSSGRDWIDSRVEDKNRGLLEKFHLFQPRQKYPLVSSHHTCAPCNQLMTLPEQHITRRIIYDFHASNSPFAFLLLDRSLFESTIVKAYEGEHNHAGSTAQVLSRACIYALFALSSVSKHIRVANYEIDGLLYASKVQAFIGVLTYTATLEGLQTILMLVSQPSNPIA